jgi:hypothetical protein
MTKRIETENCQIGYSVRTSTMSQSGLVHKSACIIVDLKEITVPFAKKKLLLLKLKDINGHTEWVNARYCFSIEKSPESSVKQSDDIIE